MKQKLYYIIFLFASYLSITIPIFSAESNPLLAVVIMVKNEEAVLAKTLEPFYEGGVRSFFIFDTGSTDNTICVAEKFFSDRPDCTGLIKQEPFVDFATSRNRALGFANYSFPQAAFFIMPDAEWYIHNVADLLSFCRLLTEQEDDGNPAYLVRLLFGSTDFYQPRLIKARSSAQFKGEVHETLYTEGKAPESVFFLVEPSRSGYEKSKKRWERDRDILLEKHYQNPFDPRTLFYLAQTYDCLNDWENARDFYLLRTQVKGWIEEDFMAHYRVAQVFENNFNNWDKALFHYLKAFSICPNRAEPLVKISQHYWSNKEIPVSHLFAKYAAEIPYPKSDSLFIDKEMYDFTRHEILGITAWHMGEFEIGKVAAQKAYEQRPHLDYLKRNVSCYVHV